MRRLICWLGWHDTKQNLFFENLREWKCGHCRKPWMEWWHGHVLPLWDV